MTHRILLSGSGGMRAEWSVLCCNNDLEENVPMWIYADPGGNTTARLMDSTEKRRLEDRCTEAHCADIPARLRHLSQDTKNKTHL